MTKPLARVTTRKNSGSDVGSRSRLNLIEGPNVLLTIADDAVNDEIDVTIGVPAGSTAITYAFNYVVYKISTTYYSLNCETGNVDYSGSAFHTVINSTMTALTSGGHIKLAKGYFYLTSPITAVNGVWIQGSGIGTKLYAQASSINMVTIASGVSHFWITNLLVTTLYGTYTGVIGIDDDGSYTKIMDVWVTNVNTGIITRQTGSAADRWYTNIYILDVNNRGIWCVKAQDHFMTNINIGTSKTVVSGGAGVLFALDEGGAGCHLTNFHIWASAGVWYGATFGTASGTYEYDAHLVSWEIEDGDGIYDGLTFKARGNYNIVNGLTIKGCLHDGIVFEGDYNQLNGFYIRVIDRYGIYLTDGQLGTSILNGTFNACAQGAIYATSAYGEARGSKMSNIFIWATPTGYNDITIYHTKYWMMTGITSYSTANTASVSVIDSSHTSLINADLYIAYTVSGTTTQHHFENVRSAGYWSKYSGTTTVANAGTIAHGLGTTPSLVRLMANGAVPIQFSYTADATNITVYHDSGGSPTVIWEVER